MAAPISDAVMDADGMDADGIRVGRLAEKELLWGDVSLSLICLDDRAKDTPCSQVFRAPGLDADCVARRCRGGGFRTVTG